MSRNWKRDIALAGLLLLVMCSPGIARSLVLAWDAGSIANASAYVWRNIGTWISVAVVTSMVFIIVVSIIGAIRGAK